MAFIPQGEIDAALTMGQVLDWAGVSGDGASQSTARGAFLSATGATEATLPRLFGVIPDEEFNLVIGAIRIRAGGEDESPEYRAQTLMERAALISVGVFCRRKTGLFDPIPLPPLAPSASTAIPASSQTLARKVKLSYIIRQGDDTEVDMLAESLIRKGYARWETLFGVGSRPSPDSEVTDSQLTAMHYLVHTENNLYVDFALWGPHGLRLERKL